MLRLEIFVHYNDQLRASHLILGCTSMGSPLLSYIDIWHRNFFPPRLTVGEAQDFGPRLIKVGSLVLVRDGSTDTVFQGHV